MTYRKAPICGERHEYFMRAGGSVRRHQHFFSKGSFEIYNSIKTTLLGGVIFLVPVVVLLAIIEKGLGYAQKAVVPVANALFKGDFTHAFVGDLLAFVLLVVLCFLAGLAAKTAFARKYVDAVEKSVLVKVPGYDAAKSQFLGKLTSKEGDSASASHEP